MTSPLRNVNVDHVNRLMEVVRIGGGFEMEKFLRVASDIGGYTPETDSRYQLDGLGKPRYTPSDITREHLLAVLETIREGEPVDRDIWVRNDPEWARGLPGWLPKTTNP